MPVKFAGWGETEHVEITPYQHQHKIRPGAQVGSYAINLLLHQSVLDAHPWEGVVGAWHKEYLGSRAPCANHDCPLRP